MLMPIVAMTKVAAPTTTTDGVVDARDDLDRVDDRLAEHRDGAGGDDDGDDREGDEVDRQAPEVALPDRGLRLAKREKSPKLSSSVEK